MLLVDAHLGYYAARTVLERLRQDVIGPARARYESICLIGISMGGLGALLYAARYPGHVTDVALLAPFVGEAPIIEDITAAGGPRSWSPSPAVELEYQEELWSWLKAYDPARRAYPRIVLGYGLQDRIVPGLGLLAGVLPGDHVFASSGRHDWRTWTRLWRAMLPDGTARHRARVIRRTAMASACRARPSSSALHGRCGSQPAGAYRVALRPATVANQAARLRPFRAAGTRTIPRAVLDFGFATARIRATRFGADALFSSAAVVTGSSVSRSSSSIIP
jgi:hypothetical protein